jgi:probable phosphoglycerate mutase
MRRRLGYGRPAMPSDWPEALLLVRHGESVGNVAMRQAYATGSETLGIEEPDPWIPLSERGQEQACTLGRWLAGLGPAQAPTVVLSSPYLRARETARLALNEAGAPLAQLPIRLDERLRDRELGVLAGLTAIGVRARYPVEAEAKARLTKFYHRPAGGESWADVALRLRSVLGDLRHDFAGERVLIFAHDLVVLLYRYLLEGMDADQVLDLGRRTEVRNGGVTLYELGAHGLVLARFNCEVTPEGLIDR